MSSSPEYPSIPGLNRWKGLVTPQLTEAEQARMGEYIRTVYGNVGKSATQETQTLPTVVETV